MCSHDKQKIAEIVTEMGILYPTVNPVDKVRSGDHLELAHTFENAKNKSNFLANERYIEHMHQPFKAAARQTVNIKKKNRIQHIYELGCAINKNRISEGSKEDYI